jgi:hypothetical protein
MTCKTKLIIVTLATFLPAGVSPLCAQVPAATQAGQVAVPDNAAGRALRSWLDAFNSGDAAKLNAYYQRYEPAKSADDAMGFRDATGGFELLSVEKSQPLHVEFLVKEKKGDTRAFGALDVAPGESGTVKHFTLLAIPAGASVADFKIDAAERGRVIDSAIAKLNESYVFPETAKRMGDSVRARLERGEYDAVTNGATFASLLTEDLQAVSHDKHLRVNFSPARLPDNRGAPPPDAVARNRRRMEQANCGFVKVEQLTGNVGYLKFNMFADPDVCGPTATAAMSFLANSDALIIDLRENGGGSPKMVAFVSSYLFSQRTHLNDLWTRVTNSTEEFWTSPDVPGKKLPDDKPVFILTSKRTFSGAEEFTYNLKNLKRATIVGETTGGGAHPVSGQRIDEHFIIGVPFARAINPITKTNWEGTGIEPDVKVPAADALATAQKLASEKTKSN